MKYQILLTTKPSKRLRPKRRPSQTSLFILSVFYVVCIISQFKVSLAFAPAVKVKHHQQTTPPPRHQRGQKRSSLQQLYTAIDPTTREIDNALPENVNGSSFKINEVDVRHDSKTSLIYDPDSDRYIFSLVVDPHERFINRLNIKKNVKQIIANSFLPEGVTKNYYNFIKWRIIQRFINANVHVFGTQSLLMGLGIQNKSALGLSAALNWVLKDALGKIVRMLWASRMGRKFDPDAKRWRYRSSLLFALGNGLEVFTYAFPSLFLVLATMANSLKQMSMLTSTSTRNALYNSFRDGTRENLGDITAKGEAQVAIVDLFGIISGVCLSKLIGTSVRSVILIWILLQVFEVSCVYKQLIHVVFRMLNFERLSMVTNSFLDIVMDSNNGDSRVVGRTYRDLLRNGSAKDIGVPTPEMVAEDERIFLPPNHLSRRGRSFGSFGRAKLSPDELQSLIGIFKRQKFLLVVGQDVKNTRVRWNHIVDLTKKGEALCDDQLEAVVEQLRSNAEENCHIVLHVNANNKDIVKSTLALAVLRRKLSQSIPTVEELNNIQESQGGDSLRKVVDSYRHRRTADCTDLIEATCKQSHDAFSLFLKVLSVRGWTTPAMGMFGRVSMRAEWPIQK